MTLRSIEGDLQPVRIVKTLHFFLSYPLKPSLTRFRGKASVYHPTRKQKSQPPFNLGKQETKNFKKTTKRPNEMSQQPNSINMSSSLSASRTPMSTGGYSIQESRRRMLETIDRRRNEMLNASSAAAAGSRGGCGPQIGFVGSAGAMPTQLPTQLPRTLPTQPPAHASAYASASTPAAAASASTALGRKNGFVNTVPTPNGGSFTHMKLPGAQQQQQQQQQLLLQQQLHVQAAQASAYRGSLASLPAGALRFHHHLAPPPPPPTNSALPPTTTIGAAGFGQRRHAKPAAVNHGLAVPMPVNSSSMVSQPRTAATASAVPVSQLTRPMSQHPDISPQPHPFFDHLELVMQPTALLPTRLNQRQQTIELTFSLTRQQAETIALSRFRKPGGQRTEYGVQVLLRCFKIGPGELQDCFPPGIALAVNANQVNSLPPPLPTCRQNADPMRPGRPVNISGHCRISHAVLNRLTVTWLQDTPQRMSKQQQQQPACYCVTVGLARVLTAQQLTERLLQLSPIATASTKARIVEMLGGGGAGDEVSLTDLTASLRCPLTRCRIGLPARGLGCPHLQCFDALSFLSMNERKSSWRCPCCDRPLPLAELRIDELFRDILSARATAEPVDTVRFLPDGGWVPVSADTELRQATASDAVTSVDLTEDASGPSQAPPPPPLPIADAGNCRSPPAASTIPKKRPAAAPDSSIGPDGILVITLDSSDDEEPDQPSLPPSSAPPAKRPNPTKNAEQQQQQQPSRPASSTSTAANGCDVSLPPSYPVSGYPNDPFGLSFGAPTTQSQSSSSSSWPPTAAAGSPGSRPGSSPATAAPPCTLPSSSSFGGFVCSGQEELPLPAWPPQQPYSIPLPPAFLQDQHRISAMLNATSLQRSFQHQQQ